MAITPRTALSRVTISGKFYTGVDELVKTHNISYMDAVLIYCEKNNVEIEVAAAMIKNNTKAKAILKEEAVQLNFLPKPESKE